jgi:hypothetical protein
MTSHRLIHCTARDLEQHLTRDPSRSHQQSDSIKMRWFKTLPPGAALIGWTEAWRGARWSISCCLEIERAATGVLAHLTTSWTGTSVPPLPPRLRTIALRAWTSHRLTELAAAVDDDRRSQQHQRAAA